MGIKPKKRRWDRNPLSWHGFDFTTPSEIGYLLLFTTNFSPICTIAEFQSEMFLLWLTLFAALAVHLQVYGGQTQFVGVLRWQICGRLLRLLYCIAHTESAAHRGHLPVKLLPSDLVVKAQPAEFDLYPKGTHEWVRDTQGFLWAHISCKHATWQLKKYKSKKKIWASREKRENTLKEPYEKEQIPPIFWL